MVFPRHLAVAGWPGNGHFSENHDVGKASLFSKKTICFYNYIYIYDYISVDDVLMTPRFVFF